MVGPDIKILLGHALNSRGDMKNLTEGQTARADGLVQKLSDRQFDWADSDVINKEINSFQFF